jgi:hypothetical protein
MLDIFAKYGRFLTVAKNKKKRGFSAALFVLTKFCEEKMHHLMRYLQILVGMWFVLSISFVQAHPLTITGMSTTLDQTNNAEERVAVDDYEESLRFLQAQQAIENMKKTLSYRVPYFNQNTVTPIRLNGALSPLTPIGQVACGCTSVAMVLAYAGKIPSNTVSMNAAVHECFRKTSSLKDGVIGPEFLVRYLKEKGFKESGFLPSPGASVFLFKLLKMALQDGPHIISAQGMGNGHYLVVLAIIPGEDGDIHNPETAQIIVHDPNGRWEECQNKKTSESGKCYNDPLGSGRAVIYSFAEMAKKGMRLYIVR